jgi:outer membrane protein assembly factor BamB
VLVDGYLLVLTEMGDLGLADARSDGYRKLGSAHVIAGRVFTAPVFANEKVFVRNIKGDVVCLDFRRKMSYSAETV